jgi:3-dehydroquinate synthase
LNTVKHSLMVNLGANSYPIYIQAGVLEHLGLLVQQAGLGPNVLLVTNPTVGGYYLVPAQRSLEAAGLRVSVATVPDGEEYKSLEWASRLYDAALEARLDRRSPVVALGGGVIGDLAGFVAATYLRGVPLIQIPTTLLAQVDSSVGGKVAVNHPRGKNLIGAFHQPALVLIDPVLLRTLSQREYIAGMAEVIKYGVIWDGDFFAYLEEEIARALQLDTEVTTRVITRCCSIKAKIVEQDEREYGVRTLLNLGHTVGHAIEAITGYQAYRHGEAVAIGMVAAGLLAVELGWWEKSDCERLNQLLTRTGLPMTIPGVDPNRLLELMQHDKKVLDGTLRWVLPRKLGEAGVVSQLSDDLVLRSLRRIILDR